MDHIKNLLCILSLSDTDKFTIEYTSHIAKIAGTENIYIVFINEHHNVPEYIKNIYPGNQFSINKDVVNKMRDDILTFHVSDAKANVFFNVFDEGNIFDNCVKFISEKQIDLVIYRKDSQNPDSSRFATKLVKRSVCSVLVLAENFSRYNNILIPVDFSSHSREALETAILFSKFAKISKVSMLHVIQHPNISNWKTDHDHEEFEEILKNHAAKEGEDFLKEIKVNSIEVDSIYKVDENIENRIHKTIKEIKIDLVVIGARGRSSGISIFLGSVTESLIKNIHVPLLAVKSKGTGSNILKLLFGN